MNARNSGWTSKIVKRFATMDDKLIELVQYAVFSGISIRLAKPLIELIVGGYISTARISNIIKKIDGDIDLWKKSKIENKIRLMRRLTRVHGHYVNEKSAERFFYGQLLLRGYIIPYHKLYTRCLT